jgi:hypothetical protein
MTSKFFARLLDQITYSSSSGWGDLGDYLERNQDGQPMRRVYRESSCDDYPAKRETDSAL